MKPTSTPIQNPHADSAAGAARANPASLPPALAAGRLSIAMRTARVAAYFATPRPGEPGRHAAPLLLVHSVNAAGSAAEVRPIFEALADSRPVLALELPGFGSSSRLPQSYTPQLMTDAILAAVAELSQLGFPGAVDLLALSLSSEFAARAALARPHSFRSVSLVSPTGLEKRQLESYEGGRSKDKPWLRAALEKGPWNEWLFKRLSSEKSMRKFLERAWGSKHIDEALLSYNQQTVRPAGARHAPYAFIAGALFTRGVAHLYEQLPQPVWVAHGERGSFAKFDGLKSIQPASRWTVDRFESGAFPHFEVPADFMKRFQHFLAGVQGAHFASEGERSSWRAKDAAEAKLESAH